MVVGKLDFLFIRSKTNKISFGPLKLLLSSEHVFHILAVTVGGFEKPLVHGIVERHQGLETGFPST